VEEARNLRAREQRLRSVLRHEFALSPMLVMCALSRRIALIAFRRMQRGCHRPRALHRELTGGCGPSWFGGCGVIASLGTFVHQTCRARAKEASDVSAMRRADPDAFALDN
jgi:hypothetical protein